MPLSNQVVSALVIGGVTVTAALVFLYVWNAPGKKVVQEAEEGEEEEEEEEEEEGEEEEEDEKTVSVSADSRSVTPQPTTQATKSSVIVEDAAEEEEEMDAEAERLAALTTQYESILNLARKLHAGLRYDKAADKFSEAIVIAEGVAAKGAVSGLSSGAKSLFSAANILSLYNNRSAMYEKAEMWEESLSDISVILSMEMGHAKTRVRRARIYEKQDKLREALHDYVVATVAEQMKGRRLDEVGPKIESLTKLIATKESSEWTDKLKQASPRVLLPNAAYCKSFMETFPSYHCWKDQHANSERSALEHTLSTCLLGTIYDAHAHLKAALALATHDMIKQDFVGCFTLISDAVAVYKSNLTGAGSTSAAQPSVGFSQSAVMVDEPDDMAASTASVAASNDLDLDTILASGESAEVKRLLSVMLDLLGVELHLKCGFSQAVSKYSLAVELDNEAFETMLKLASVYAETGQVELAESTFVNIFALLEKQLAEGNVSPLVSGGNRAWSLLHRAALWVNRNHQPGSASSVQSESVDRATTDLNESLNITTSHEAEGTNEMLQACHLIALLKSIAMVTQFKQQQAGAPPPSAEDHETVKAYLSKAQGLDKSHEGVIQSEVDVHLFIGEMDLALEKCDQWLKNSAAAAQENSGSASAMPYVFKANILFQKACEVMQQGFNPETIFKEIDSLFGQAMEVEPYGVDVLVQHANIKSIVGDPVSSLKLAEKALPLATRHDEIQEILQIRTSAATQTAALRELGLIPTN